MLQNLITWTLILFAVAFPIHAHAATPQVELLVTPDSETEALLANVSNQSLEAIDNARLVVRVENSDGDLLRASLLSQRVSLAPGMSETVTARMPDFELRDGEVLQLATYPADAFGEAPHHVGDQARIEELRESLLSHVANPSGSQTETLERLQALRRDVEKPDEHFTGLEGCMVYCLECANMGAILCSNGVEELVCNCSQGICSAVCYFPDHN